MCVLGQPEPIGTVLTFRSGYDTLEYSWVKATAVSVHLRILFVMLQSTNSAKELCWTVIADMERMMHVLLCKLEKIFPLSFFNLM